MSAHPKPSRRVVLQSATAGLAALLVGCESAPPAEQAASPTSSASVEPAPPPRGTGALLQEVAPDRTSDLQVINASFETLTGDDQLFAFGIVGADNTPVTGADVQVWTQSREGEQPTGPIDAEFREIPNQPLGLYVVRLDLPVAGTIPMAAVTADGAAGQTLMRVADEETAAVPPPGAPAPVVATPTADDMLGYEFLCTQSPPCGMHDISLDEALRAGEPVMLSIATPGFCETAICGPTVEVVDRVRASGAGDPAVRWIHVEVFTDAGTTVADPVTAWELQSEPWVFGIAADGTIAGRLDGPLTILDDEVAALADSLV
ncbi:hypothetical protein [Euzebya pacifica]|jgi:hypothetical protein|uniref:hypothetical protein n=1 Tax=Euzebya pacifica TaxID=1608957 RepID=UPI0030FB6542